MTELQSSFLNRKDRPKLRVYQTQTRIYLPSLPPKPQHFLYHHLRSQRDKRTSRLNSLIPGREEKAKKQIVKPLREKCLPLSDGRPWCDRCNRSLFPSKGRIEERSTLCVVRPSSPLKGNKWHSSKSGWDLFQKVSPS